jgi:3-deoxy-7-phosphoheptulonate synthase
MPRHTSDLRICATKPLLAPAVLEDELPLDEARAEFVAKTRDEIAAILSGSDDRLFAVVGPCSIHDPESAVQYAGLLQAAAARHAAELLIVMRVYFEKPRTVAGWKGLISDPDIDGTFRINKGLRLARKLMLDIAGLGLGVGTEFLDTTFGQYYADLVSWGSIGARTVESQIHRQLASGLSMPVGFKNRTDGDVQVAVDAILSARHPHWFPSVTREGAPAIMETLGNDQTHIVLRGGTRGPNFSSEHVRAAAALLRAKDLPPGMMIDCSHANCGKDAEREPAVAADVAAQVASGERAIAAVMIESNLLGGVQDYRQRPLVPGRSITDPCLSWEKTLPVLAELAGAVRARRKKTKARET